MKKILLLVVIVFTSVTVQAQSFRFQTKNLSIIETNNGHWGKWSTPKKTEIIVNLDYDKNKLIIYSANIQYYKIVEYLGAEVSETDEIQSYLCTTMDGMPVKISFFVRKNLNNKTQLYIYHKKFAFCYDIEEIIN